MTAYRRVLLAELLEERTLLATFTVSNENASGLGSFQQAIFDSNASPGPDTIDFDSSVASIVSPSGMPSITDTVIIDGTGPTGQPGVELAGPGGPFTEFHSGLTVLGSGSTIKGLVINGFLIGVQIQSENTRLENNYIGTDVNGTSALGNNDGVRVAASKTTIVDNLISGNVTHGIATSCSPSCPSEIVIQGNLIGTTADGLSALANQSVFSNGVSISGGSGHRIGGPIAAERNVISGNSLTGISISSVVSDTKVEGNYVGLDATGSSAIPNLRGINLAFSSGVTIGGATANHRNVISGNIKEGITGRDWTNVDVDRNYIGVDAAGTTARPNGWQGIRIIRNAINVGIEGNLISGNGRQGMFANQSQGLLIVDNYLGVNVDGTSAIPNSQQGVTLRDTSAVTIEGNLISGNGLQGIFAERSQGLMIVNNYLGVNFDGTSAIPNLQQGVSLLNTSTVTIDGNVISGHVTQGILGIGSQDLMIIGNYLGVNSAGTGAIPNGQGIFFNNVSNALIGGANSGEPNVISGNRFVGMFAFEQSQELEIRGNYIGVDSTGTNALPNGEQGILLRGVSNVTIGGANPGERNVISGNGWQGISAEDQSGLASQLITINGNYIGIDSAGIGAIPNGRDGILGRNPEDIDIEGNLIAHNGRNGVRVVSGLMTAVRSNSIVDNGGLGIELLEAGVAGVTANDAGDADSGANNLQNFPVLSEFYPGTSTRVAGSLNSTPNTTFTIDVYANTVADSSGYGEGERFLGSFTVVTDAGGDVSFDEVLVSAASTSGEFITTTATDLDGNSSEFSAALSVDDDSDGIFNTVDTAPSTVSNDFSDGTTIGTITSRGDQILQVEDAPLTADGVKITADASGGTTAATFSLCGGTSTFSVSAGDELIVTCGSVTVAVFVGPVEVTFVASSGDVATTTLSGNNSLTFEPTTVTFTAPTTNVDTTVVVVNGAPISVAPGQSVLAPRIDIKPGTAINPINPKSKGTISVAILSSAAFDAPAQVNPDTLKFGRTGDEDSLRRSKRGEPRCGARDVNGDSRTDLVCDFLGKETGFQYGDTEGILKGQLFDGSQIEGRDAIKIVGGKPLHVAGGSANVAMIGETLTPAMLQTAVHQAMVHWTASGLAAQQVGRLNRIDIQPIDLSGSLLGLADANTIWIDVNAAGYGWSIDRSRGGANLVTALAHELGHVLGLDHDAAEHDVMAATLSPTLTASPLSTVLGEKVRSPSASLLDRVYESLDELKAVDECLLGELALQYPNARLDQATAGLMLRRRPLVDHSLLDELLRDLGTNQLETIAGQQWWRGLETITSLPTNHSIDEDGYP